ncbi:MAG: hypothetical protein Q4A27_00195 [bacterium]|nr:hypothetical protein [bacterium]
MNKESILRTASRRFAVIYNDDKMKLIEFYELLAGQNFATTLRVYMLGGEIYFDEHSIEIEEISEILLKKAISLVGKSFIQRELRELANLIKKLSEVPLEDIKTFDKLESLAAKKFQKIYEKYIAEKYLKFFKKK